MTRRCYNSDLPNREWAILAPLIPPPRPGGRSVSWERREIVDAVLYVLRSGCTWRRLPHDFPPWQTVSHYWRLWRRDGTWERVHTNLREQARRRAGREVTPSAVIRDEPVGQDDGKRGLRGYDGGKKLKGRKRHILVDTQGFVLQLVVHPANLADRDGGKLVLCKLEPWQEHFPRLKHLWLDSAYQGKFEEWVKATFGWNVEVVKHWWTGVRGFWVPPGGQPPVAPRGFVPLKWRWIVERTFGWLGRQRRLSKDYEFLPETSEAWISLAMSRLMLKRLAHEEVVPPFHSRRPA